MESISRQRDSCGSSDGTCEGETREAGGRKKDGMKGAGASVAVRTILR